MPVVDQDDAIFALDRLVVIAQSDTGQASHVANFLLAWGNATDCGGFDLTDLWMAGRAITDDVLTVARLIATRHEFPTADGYGRQFERLVADWRPRLFVPDEASHG